jgi:hypothetical protein
LDSYGSEWEPMMDSCKYGNETLGSIKGGEFLDYLSVDTISFSRTLLH